MNLKHCYIHWCYFLKLNFYSFLGKGVHGPHVEVRGQLKDIQSLLPLCGLQRWNSNQQVWRQVLLPCKSSPHWLGGLFLLENYDLSSFWLPVANIYHSLLTLDAGNRHIPVLPPQFCSKKKGTEVNGISFALSTKESCWRLCEWCGLQDLGAHCVH